MDLIVTQSVGHYYRDLKAKREAEGTVPIPWLVQSAECEAIDERIILAARSIKNNYVEIGLCLCELRDRHLTFDIYRYAAEHFGIKKTSTYLLISIAEQFTDDGVLADKWKDYSYSQLCEILPMSEKQRQGVRSSMTIKELRTLKDLAKDVTSNVQSKIQTSEQPKEGADVEYEVDEIQTSEHTSKLQMPEQQELAVDFSLRELADPVVVVSDVDVPVHTVLLNLKNRKAREAWLEKYHDWGVWLSVPDLEMTLYKFVFANGHELVVSESYYFDSWSKKKQPLIRYHLKSDKCTFFDMGGIAKTYVLDYLTEFAREI